MRNRDACWGVGLVGAGRISRQYLQNLVAFEALEVRFVADLDSARASALADEFGVPQAGTAEQLLAREDIDVVVNLTIPAAHAEVSTAALASGKHVWSEKPIATRLTDALALAELAEAGGLRVGCAPDTVLGRGIQQALRLVHDGAIGVPLRAAATFLSPGPERSHPDPEFLYRDGAGPLFDMGPYFLTALVQALGPVTEVSGSASTARQMRTILVGPRQGAEFPVTTPTHYEAHLVFESASADTAFSFDAPAPQPGSLAIVGTEGRIEFPDPNQFGGVIRLIGGTDATTRVIEADSAGLGRGIGVAEMMEAVTEDRPHRADARLARHVLEVMTAIARSADSGTRVAITDRVEPAALLPADWDPRRAAARAI